MNILKMLIAFFLLIICKSSFAQKLNKIEREYFILGTLSDYMGRYLDPSDKNLLDRYYANEAPLIIVIDSLLKIDYPVSDYKIERHFDPAGNLSNAKIFSAKLSDLYNSYYRFTPSGSFTMDYDTIRTGKLKGELFKNDEEKLAFLAGAYVRFGMTNDTAYEISIANSASKASVCYQLLVDFKCKPSYQKWKNYIPVGHHVYFHPDDKLRANLQHYLYLRKMLNDSLILFFERMRSEEEKVKKP